MIPKEMKHNLHYGEVRGDVLQYELKYKYGRRNDKLLTETHVNSLFLSI